MSVGSVGNLKDELTQTSEVADNVQVHDKVSVLVLEVRP